MAQKSPSVTHDTPQYQHCVMCGVRRSYQFSVQRKGVDPHKWPYSPFSKKFSRSSVKFSESSWSSINFRMTANSAWATGRENKHHCGVGDTSEGAFWIPTPPRAPIQLKLPRPVLQHTGSTCSSLSRELSYNPSQNGTASTHVRTRKKRKSILHILQKERTIKTRHIKGLRSQSLKKLTAVYGDEITDCYFLLRTLTVSTSCFFKEWWLSLLQTLTFQTIITFI